MHKTRSDPNYASQARRATEERKPEILEETFLPAQPSKRKGLSYKEQKEWDQIEAKIHESEEQIAACQSAASDPAIASSATDLQERYAALHAAQADVEGLYARWAELDEKRAQVIGNTQP